MGAFAVSPDGQRFLMIKEGATTDATVEGPEIYVVLNWFEELTRLVPDPWQRTRSSRRPTDQEHFSRWYPFPRNSN